MKAVYQLKKTIHSKHRCELFFSLLEVFPNVKNAMMTNMFDNRANKYFSWGFTLLFHIIQFDIMPLVCQLTAMS